MYITWNKAVRKIHALQCDTQRRSLDPLTNQRHLKYIFFARDIK